MLIEYNAKIQKDIEIFFEIVINARGWNFDINGKHSIIKNIPTSFPKEYGGFWIEIIENKIIGTVGIRQIDFFQRIAELKSMYVLPEYQGKGYGRKLMEFALSKAKTLNYKTIRLDTTLDSYKALDLYEKNGFYRIERYNKNMDAQVFMEKEL